MGRYSYLVTRKGHSDALRDESYMMRWSQHSKAIKKSILVRKYKSPGKRRMKNFSYLRRRKSTVECNGQG